MESTTDTHNFNKLNNRWTLYAHLPHDTNWKVDSYKEILTFTTAEEGIALTETIPEVMTNNCMLFLMRDNIKPIWEDNKNRKGGCLSFKVQSNVSNIWKKLCLSAIGENISQNNKFTQHITGVTISPKRNFCIMKIWMKNCDYKTASCINSSIGLDTQGVLFKKHTPQY